MKIVSPYSFFYPTHLTSLRMWFDASDAATITESSGSVSQWDDKSGNEYHVTQATSANQPITGTRTINGINALDFNGSTHVLRRTGTPDMPQPNTVFVVADADTIGNLQFVIDSGAGAQREVITGYGSPAKWALWAGNIPTQSSSDTVDPMIMSAFFNAASSKMRINGTQVLSNAPIGTFRRVGISIGGSVSAASFNGLIGEILVYDNLLTDSQTADVERFLSDKWGIALS